MAARPHPMRAAAIVLTAAACLPGAAAAHGAGDDVGHDLGRAAEIAWTAPLGFLAAAYGLGLARLWRRAGVGRGVTRGRAFCFFAGIASVFVLLLSSLDAWAERLLAAHMAQHLGLMLVAAPLMALGRPGAALAAALPRRVLPALRRFRCGVVGRRAALLFHPLSAWAIYLLALWIWHAPPLFEAALRADGVHWAQHATFLGAALLFWTVVLDRARGDGRLAAVLAIFATAVQSCALAALLTLSPALWYPTYAERGGGWGLSPLEDQQLGGLIMWGPCCALLIGAALAVLARALERPAGWAANRP